MVFPGGTAYHETRFYFVCKSVYWRVVGICQKLNVSSPVLLVFGKIVVQTSYDSIHIPSNLSNCLKACAVVFRCLTPRTLDFVTHRGLTNEGPQVMNRYFEMACGIIKLPKTMFDT